MRTQHVWIIAVSIFLSALAVGGGLLLSQRYEIVETSTGNNVAWKLDRLTGQAYGCEESEFGPFCIPAPNQIKHSQ